jgi:NAD(P)H dehydrogenase (quinone)
MKHLIIYSHFNKDSFSSAIKNIIVEQLEKSGHEVIIQDLYELNFNPVLSLQDKQTMIAGDIPEDIKREQEVLSSADYVHFVFPIWWTGLPAMVKGYIDRVFTYGYAYEMKDGNLVGLLNKKLTIVNTHGFPSDYYTQIGMYDAFKNTIINGIFNFSGFELVKHHLFGSVPYIDDNARKEILSQVEEFYSKI